MRLDNGQALPAWLQLDTATWRLTGTPALGDAGVLSLRVTAGDGEFSVSDVFLLGVHTQANHAPVVPAAAFDGVEDVVLTGSLPAATDSDGDATQYAWEGEAVIGGALQQSYTIRIRQTQRWAEGGMAL